MLCFSAFSFTELRFNKNPLFWVVYILWEREAIFSSKVFQTRNFVSNFYHCWFKFWCVCFAIFVLSLKNWFLSLLIRKFFQTPSYQSVYSQCTLQPFNRFSVTSDSVPIVLFQPLLSASDQSVTIPINVSPSLKQLVQLCWIIDWFLKI